MRRDEQMTNAAINGFVQEMIRQIDKEVRERGPHVLEEIILNNMWNQELEDSWDTFAEKHGNTIIERVKEHYGR